MPGARRGALPLAVSIVVLLLIGISLAAVRGGDETPQADGTPTPTFTLTTTSPTPTGTATTPPSPTDSPTESPTTSPTATSGTGSPTTVPPTTTTSPVPTTTGGEDMPDTGLPVGGWLFGGVALMVLASALLRSVTRPA